MISKPDAQAQWAQRRALYEGATATVERLAMACGLTPAQLEKRAGQEGWRGGAEDREGALATRIRTARIKLLEAVERRQAKALDGKGGLDAASIAELTAIARMLEKLGEDTRGESGAKENQAQHEDEIAAVVERLDRKIVELAAHLAGRMADRELSSRGIEGGDA